MTRLPPDRHLAPIMWRLQGGDGRRQGPPFGHGQLAEVAPEDLEEHVVGPGVEMLVHPGHDRRLVAVHDEGGVLTAQLGPHTMGKGCLYIRDLSAINADVLSRMIGLAYQAKAAL